MSLINQTNQDRMSAFLKAAQEIAVYDLDGAHADNINEMQNRHHALQSLVNDYFEADIRAFNWETGAQIDVSQVEALDTTFRDFVADEYQKARKTLRNQEDGPSVYDRARNQRVAA